MRPLFLLLPDFALTSLESQFRFLFLDYSCFDLLLAHLRLYGSVSMLYPCYGGRRQSTYCLYSHPSFCSLQNRKRCQREALANSTTENTVVDRKERETREGEVKSCGTEEDEKSRGRGEKESEKTPQKAPTATAPTPASTATIPARLFLLAAPVAFADAEGVVPVVPLALREAAEEAEESTEDAAEAPEALAEERAEEAAEVDEGTPAEGRKRGEEGNKW